MATPIKEYEHYCKYCNKLLTRNRFKNGRLEDFNRRYKESKKQA